MGITFTIHQSAIGLVRDEEVARPIGTAFSFLLPHWFVTAKHVVMLDYGETRREISLVLNKAAPVSAQVLFVHPDVDLAVLRAPRNDGSRILPRRGCSTTGTKRARRPSNERPQAARTRGDFHDTHA